MNANSPPPVNKRPLRRALLAFSLLVVFVVCCFTVMAFIPPRRLLVENFPQIRIGMTQSEVESLLGGPPGNFGKHFDGMKVMTGEDYLQTPGSIRKDWCDDNHMFEIYFDAQSRVLGVHQRFSYSQTPDVVPFGSWNWFRRWIREKTGW